MARKRVGMWDVIEGRTLSPEAVEALQQGLERNKIGRFDPQERAREKQASRDRDDAALAAGTTTVEELDARNEFLTADRTIVHWRFEQEARQSEWKPGWQMRIVGFCCLVGLPMAAVALLYWILH